ncbi:MAG TPA: NAD(P)/FAD-dependent oxidoreductase [Solirubrobacteraceae bacterium]|nr:NAD(P)/FAD-dependent oxidoreductase [Solirubrobacteraceae bacterium]
MSDVIVVGAGHNGLVAACYLARAGLDVLVVERSAQIGGCTTSGALVPQAPEHLLNACAADIITMRSSTVVADLQLATRFGYREVEIDPAYALLAPDGSSLLYWRDPVRTAQEIRRHSPADARAYLELMAVFDDVLAVALPMIATNPTRPEPRALWGALKAAARHPRSVAVMAGLAVASAEQAIRERFSDELVQSALAVIANFGAPITGESTATNLILPAVISRFGMGRPVGGMGALPAAIERALRAAGGRVRTSAPVAEIIIERGRAVGVQLCNGEELRAARVLTATEPYGALHDLLPADALSARDAARVAAIPCDNDGCTHFKIEMAFRGRLALDRHQAARSDTVDLRIPSAMVGSIDEVVAAIGAARGGRMPDPLPFVSMIPTAADPTQAPAGMDTLSLWSGWLPHHPPGGWPSAKATVEQAFVAHAARYFDGIEQLEIGRAVETPEEISDRTGVRNGNVYHVDVTLTRLGPLRPALGFGGYRTPVPGLYITGAGTHPGPSVSGIPGQQAARTILRDVRRSGAGPAPRTWHAQAPIPAPEVLV